MSKFSETHNARYNLRRATRARAASLPQSPMAQPGAETIEGPPPSKANPVGSQPLNPIENPADTA
ncbi:hypothetical protein M404DRAFT_1007826, partial [Pisolithus tinctorius Marx 270]